jgi:hypothetical protein
MVVQEEQVMTDGTQATVDGTADETIELLALIGAQDGDGNIDPLAREAGRLVLRNQALGGVDAAGLVRSMIASPVYPGRKRSPPMIQAISSRLDPASARRFERALDDADITDTAFESAVEKTGGGLFGIGRFLVKAVHWVDDRISDGLAAAHRWAENVASDRDRNPLVRALAGIVEKPIELAQTAYGTVRAPVMRIAGAVEDVAEVGKFAYRFASNEHYRDALFALGKMRLVESVGEPAQVAGDLAVKASRSLDELQEGLAKARSEGKEAEYLANLASENGLKIFSQVLPTAAFEKLDLLANTLDDISLDEVEEVRKALGDAATAIEHGGAAGQAGTRVWEAMIREFRADGELAALVDMARDDGHLDLMLGIGELSPGELADLLKIAPDAFARGESQQAGVSFDEALDASLRNLDLSALGADEAGALAEAIMTRDMLRNGYVGVAALENASGNGITLAGRNASGELDTFAVDSLAFAEAIKALPRDGEHHVEQLAALLGTDPRLPRIAVEREPAAAARAGDNPYAGLARNEILLDDPAHRHHALYAQASRGVHVLDARLDRTPDIRSEQLGGALAVAALKAGLDRIDHVVISDDATRVFAVQGTPGSPQSRVAWVETVAATQQPLARSTALMAKFDAESTRKPPQAMDATQGPGEHDLAPSLQAMALH